MLGELLAITGTGEQERLRELPHTVPLSITGQDRRALEAYVLDGHGVESAARIAGLTKYRVNKLLALSGIPKRKPHEGFPNVKRSKPKPRGRYAHLK